MPRHIAYEDNTGDWDLVSGTISSSMEMADRWTEGANNAYNSASALVSLHRNTFIGGDNSPWKLEVSGSGFVAYPYAPQRTLRIDSIYAVSGSSTLSSSLTMSITGNVGWKIGIKTSIIGADPFQALDSSTLPGSENWTYCTNVQVNNPLGSTANYIILYYYPEHVADVHGVSLFNTSTLVDMSGVDKTGTWEWRLSLGNNSAYLHLSGTSSGSFLVIS